MPRWGAGQAGCRAREGSGIVRFRIQDDEVCPHIPRCGHDFIAGNPLPLETENRKPLREDGARKSFGLLEETLPRGLRRLSHLSQPCVSLLSAPGQRP
jgi:hypothetical protein